MKKHFVFVLLMISSYYTYAQSAKSYKLVAIDSCSLYKYYILDVIDEYDTIKKVFSEKENLIEVPNIEIGQEIRLLLEEFTLNSQLEEGARDRRFYAVFVEGKLILRRGEKAYKARNLRGLYLIDDSQH